VKALFLINARSGKRRSYDVAEVIRGACDWLDHEVRPCGSIEELDGVIAGAVRDGFDVVYAVGGDGTVHEVAKRLIGTPLALGILPTGSGNGFARHVGLPTAPRDSLLACRGGRIETIDTAEVNGKAFVGVMGVGFDAYVADRFAASTTRGLRTYLRAGLLGYASYRPEEYSITVDGEETRRTAFVLAVANSSQYGNNARIAPLASLQDGLLDVVVIRDASLLRAPLMIARLFAGTIHRSRGVNAAQGREIIIRRGAPGPAHLDGEPLTLPETLHVTVRPQSLRILVPERTGRL